MKKLIVFFLCAFICIAFSSCEQSELKSSRITELGQYTGYEYIYNEPVVSDDEIRESIETAYAFDKAIKYDITDRVIIQKDDFAVVRYKMYVDGERYEKGIEGAGYYSTTTEDQNMMKVIGTTFKVGAGFFLLDLENQMIGKEINKEYSLDVKIPDDFVDGNLAGKSAKFEITAIKLYYYDIPKMTDEYFQSMGYASYDEYFAFVKKMKEYDSNYWERERVCEEIITKIVQNSTFELLESDVNAEFEAVKGQHQLVAKINELTLEDYIDSYLNLMSAEDFEGLCRKEAEFNIQKELVCNELIRLMDIQLSDDELKTMAKERFYLSSENIAEMGDELKNFISMQLMYDFLLENSTRINP